jgi:hypothetical protein
MNSEPLPTKLLKITERFYGRTFFTSQQDIDRAGQLGLTLIRCRCRNGTLVARYHAEMGWSGKAGGVFHRQYLEGATIEEVKTLPTLGGKELP